MAAGPGKDQPSLTANPLLQDIVSSMPTASSAVDGVVGKVPPQIIAKVNAEVSRAERWEHFRCRISNFRDKYSVTPGLYAFGEPDVDDDVLVSANYKLSFDALRRELPGMNFWILVLDTKGINVWCAAGKGTFGTGELVRQVAASRLGAVVSHRRLIVPQLGAVGVNASEIRKRTGFKVRFGPVLAADLPAYIQAGYQKTAEMSTVRFSLKDRVVLTPMELSPSLKKYPWFAAAVLLIFGLQRDGIIFADAWSGGLPFLLLGLVTIAAGAFMAPALLPWLPFRSFAVKGWIAGAATVLLASLIPVIADPQHDAILRIVAYLLFPALSSYIALQFTGSTTYTGMTGVRKELKISLPLYIGVAALSLVLMVVFKLGEWGIW